MWAGPGRGLGPGHLPPRGPAPAGAADDDLRLDLGAAEARRTRLSLRTDNRRGKAAHWCPRRSRRGSIGSARAAAFARCDLGGDHAPGDGLTAPQLPESGRGPDDGAEPAAADIPAVDTDVDPGELTAADLPQVLRVHDASDGSQVRSCSGEPSRSNQDLGRGQDAHHNSMGTCGVNNHYGECRGRLPMQWQPRRRVIGGRRSVSAGNVAYHAYSAGHGQPARQVRRHCPSREG